ncbi:MAG: 4Fe-4S dicluster domain-containing protein, partial [Bacteroidota bacterium]
MKQKNFKKIRVVISLVFLITITWLFLDFRETIGTGFFQTALYLQFVPSLVKFLTVFSISALGFLIVILLTALAGRVYCSTICPLGIFQDVISYISKKIPRKKKFRYKYAKPYTILRYSLLGLTIITFVFGSIFVVNLLDPYSNFGRIITNLFKPLFLGLNNAAAFILEKFDVYSLYPVDIQWGKLSALAFPVFMFALILAMAIRKGRLYCNTVCPVGTLLGFMSKYSFFKIRFNEDRCTSCGKCAVVCKAQCINIKEKSVDETRCIDCFNCLDTCPEQAIYYQKPKKVNLQPVRPGAPNTDDSKRKFVASILAYTALSIGIKPKIKAADVVVKNPTTVPLDKTHPVSMPGSGSIEHLKDKCTACHLCISACPTGVIQPSFLQYGITGMMQPHMDFEANYCNFDCTRCTEICPTGALLPVSAEEKKTLQLGKVVFIIENCVVYTEGTACGSCSEHCPTQAVYMIPYKGNLTIPEINPDICVGCGACEYACPTRPYRAIYVDGNETHLVADIPKSEKLDDVDI